MALIEPPDGIIITLPRKFFEEHDHATYLEEIKAMNTEDDRTWIRVMKNLPKQDFLYVYTIIDNKIHHRSMFAGLIRNHTFFFKSNKGPGGRKCFPNANAVVMCGPVVFPSEEIKMKGFQGFRYTKTIF